VLEVPSRAAGHPDPECRRSGRNGACDSAKANQPELLAAQLRAQHEVEGPAFPFAPSNEPLALGKTPCDCEDERPGEIGHRFGEDVRRVRHNHATRPGVDNIDIVEADGDVGNYLEVCGGV